MYWQKLWNPVSRDRHHAGMFLTYAVLVLFSELSLHLTFPVSLLAITVLLHYVPAVPV